MSPDIEKSPVPLTLVTGKITVLDIIYNPLKTRLLAGAEKRGAKVISGFEMLVWQGAAALEPRRRESPGSGNERNSFKGVKSS